MLDLDTIMLDPSNSRIIGGARLTDKTDYVFFPPRAEKVWRSAAAAYPDADNVEWMSWSADWNKIVLQVSGANYGDIYYLVDMAAHRSTRLVPNMTASAR